MNIIVNDDLTVKLTQYDPDIQCAISDISVYIPNTFVSHKAFMIIEDSNKVYEICELSHSKNMHDYTVYSFPQGQHLRIKSGKCKCSVALIDIENHNCMTSRTIEVNLNIELYRYSHNLYAMQLLSTEMLQIYQKTVETANLMIGVCEKFQERVGE